MMTPTPGGTFSTYNHSTVASQYHVIPTFFERPHFLSTGFNDDAKEQIRQMVDIVDLVGQSINLERRGKLFLGLCPWHTDNRPSLQVDPNRQTWKCWPCNLGGDIFSFIMQREGVEFREALELLADIAGIELKKSNRPKAEPGSPDDKRTLFKAAQWAAELFHQHLLHSHEAANAREYLQSRGITSDSIKKYRVGFAPNDWEFLLRESGRTEFSPQVLHAVALLGFSEARKKYYDFFRGRVMFPIHDTRDRTVAFGGRILPQYADDKNAKYVNSPETKIFSKSDNLYGIDVAIDAIRKGGKVLVMEGYTDVIMASQYGVTNVVAVLGTAINDVHVRNLKRLADVVTLVLDGDEAGKKRANEVLEYFVKGQLDLRILTLPANLDPCDYLQERGTQDFLELTETAVDALQHKLNVELDGVDPLRDTHAANAALQSVLQTMALVANEQVTTDIAARQREQLILGRLARTFALDQDELHNQLSALRTQKQSGSAYQLPNSASVPLSTPQHPTPRPRVRLTAMETELLELLIERPDLAPGAAREIYVDDLATDPMRIIYGVYTNRVVEGLSTNFDEILLEIEDPQLKFVLVDTAENAKNKAKKVQLSPEQRLDSLVQSISKRIRDGERREFIRQLENNEVAPDQEAELLQQILDQEREDQGLT